jgi:uncharacterized membrane protein YdjX (TVP38/TMEM64 family)
MHPLLWGMLGALILFGVVIAFTLAYLHGRKVGRQQGAQAMSEYFARSKTVVFSDESRGDVN